MDSDQTPGDTPGKGVSKRLPPEHLTRDDPKKPAAARPPGLSGAAGGNIVPVRQPEIKSRREFERSSAAVCGGGGVSVQDINNQVNDLSNMSENSLDEDFKQKKKNW
jgi:hypothetical protein